MNCCTRDSRVIRYSSLGGWWNHLFIQFESLFFLLCLLRVFLLLVYYSYAMSKLIEPNRKNPPKNRTKTENEWMGQFSVNECRWKKENSREYWTLFFPCCLCCADPPPSCLLRLFSDTSQITNVSCVSSRSQSARRKTKDEDEGENLSKNSPIKTWKWKHKSTRNRFESEILAGIKKKEERG